jgi:hypothetical protein
MMIKDILLPLTSYPTPTQKQAVENAVALAESIGALVSAVAFEVDVQSPVGLYADPVGVSGIFAADRKKSAYNARDLLANFATSASLYAGKSTLNRLELSKLAPTRYHKISHNPMAIKNLLVDLFVEAHERAPRQIILDLDATDDPLHGEQEARFFHGYHDCYCYLPLYVFCGRHLLVAKLRSAAMDAAAGAIEEVARVVAQIRRRWPRVRILLRADSGFAREDLMAWCEANGIDFLFGLAKNERLIAEIKTELDVVAAKSRRTGRMERRFKSFMWMTRRTWSRRRRIVAKAEWTQGEANPRFVVTSLGRDACKPSTCTRRSTAPAATWRTGSRNASSTSMPIAPRPPPCEPINCACGLPQWPTCCSVHCAVSACMTPTSPKRLAAPFVSSCSRSVRSCASASAASRSPWRPPVRPPMTGSAPRSGSRLPPWHAPRQHDTQSRDAAPSLQIHRDQLFAATAARKRPSRPRVSRRHGRLCLQKSK